MYRLLLFLAAITAFGETPKVTTDTAVIVFVNGQGELPGPLWYGTRALVSSMFAQIGIPITWQTGKPPLHAAPRQFVIACHFAAKEPGATAIHGRVCTTPGALACSFPFEADVHPVIIMYERVRSWTRRPRLLEPLLALAVAHEFAHVLSARDEHSQDGIMKEHWTTTDFDRIESARPQFTARDVDAIQQGFDYRRRISPASPTNAQARVN